VETDSGSRQQFDTEQALVKQLEATVAQDEAQADAARLQLDYATIRAPFDGRAGARLIDVGNIVHPADATALVVITQTTPIGVTFAIPQNLLESLRTAQRDAPVPVDALEPGSSEPLDSGRLTLIDNQADPTTGTIRCKALFPNRAEVLWPGQLVSARVRMGTYRDAIVVPAQAIQTGPKGTYVYVAQDGMAKMRPVKVGTIEGDVAAIVEGLKEGEAVVTEGQFRIEPDSRIAVPG
jgi:multidrug efflux system membrane fusion protein